MASASEVEPSPSGLRMRADQRMQRAGRQARILAWRDTCAHVAAAVSGAVDRVAELAITHEEDGGAPAADLLALADASRHGGDAALASKALHAGDILAILDTGMYADAISNQFNGIPRPATILVGSGGVAVIKRRETVADLFGHHVIPGWLQA